MSDITLRDILINARQESVRMQHYYIGVEHLFISLLEMNGSLARAILEEQGLTTEYVIDAIRRKLGKGGKQRLWAGIPNSPRADVVINMAQDLAFDAERDEIIERDLLTAMLMENDSVPVRVLRRLGVNLTALAEEIRTRRVEDRVPAPFIRIEFSADFPQPASIPDGQLFILRRMFHGYSQLRIERRLTGGYTKAALFVVTPIHADDLEDASVVVKIDHADAIQDEAHRYETYIRATLPPLTARLEDKPTAPEMSELAGLRYTFISPDADRRSVDLRAARDFGIQDLGAWLQTELFPTFGHNWWQRQRPFRFFMWQEYDWLLPPVLTLEWMPPDSAAETHSIKAPIRRARLRTIQPGDVVCVENFTVQRVYHDRNALLLTIGNGTEAAKRAYKIELRGVDLKQDTYYRGETLELVLGRVWSTRAEAMMHAANALEPEFDLRLPHLPYAIHGDKLPNPLLAYDALLEQEIDGTQSTIHGDLHLGNILIGPNRSPFLIDYGQTRVGHTLFDWAVLELSILNELVLRTVSGDWDSLRELLPLLAALNARATLPPARSDILDAVTPLKAVRGIVARCLADPGKWDEYYSALALCAIRAMTWETVSRDGRRLMFLVSALAIHALRQSTRSIGSIDTASQNTDKMSPNTDLID